MADSLTRITGTTQCPRKQSSNRETNWNLNFDYISELVKGKRTYIFEVLDAVQVAAEKGFDVSGCDGFIHKGAQLGEDEHEDQ